MSRSATPLSLQVSIPDARTNSPRSGADGDVEKHEFVHPTGLRALRVCALVRHIAVFPIRLSPAIGQRSPPRVASADRRVQSAVTEGARVLPTDRRPLELRQSGVWNGEDFQARFDALAVDGVDVHGEAHFVTTLGPGSVLDAGCGTGRVAIELARRGIEVVGVDAESSMIATARQRAPELAWFVADLANLELGRTFDVVIMAGNVPLFTRAGTQAALVAGCARHVSPGGALVCGLQLGRGYDLATYDQQCAHAGLELIQRWATWDREPFHQDGSYAVSVHSPRINQSADEDRNEDSSTGGCRKLGSAF